MWGESKNVPQLKEIFEFQIHSKQLTVIYEQGIISKSIQDSHSPIKTN